VSPATVRIGEIHGQSTGAEDASKRHTQMSVSHNRSKLLSTQLLVAPG